MNTWRKMLTQLEAGTASVDNFGLELYGAFHIFPSSLLAASTSSELGTLRELYSSSTLFGHFCFVPSR